MQPVLEPAGGWLHGPPRGADLTILHVWALSCGRCKGQLPHVTTWQGLDGVELISIHTPIAPTDHDPAAVSRLAASYGLVAPIALDTDGVIADALGVTSLPAYVVLDAAGRVLLKAAGNGADRHVAHLISSFAPAPGGG
ncbi:MAG: TlpA family protein disulfide reductase [Myxococcales bacterium]|nr:TlpA family protein disulfide reductase [Myxococcales bacterium]